MRENKRDREMQDIIGFIGICLLFYGILSVALWLVFISLNCLLIWLTCRLITNPKITKRLRLKILIGGTAGFLLYLGRYDMITNYPVIDEAIRKFAFELVQLLK